MVVPVEVQQVVLLVEVMVDRLAAQQVALPVGDQQAALPVAAQQVVMMAVQRGAPMEVRQAVQRRQPWYSQPAKRVMSAMTPTGNVAVPG